MRRTPSGGAGSGTAARRGGLMSIGTVLQQLREEFPEVTISKIRFLEAEGLVEPRRTPSGYRKFSPDDVERLAYVLRIQRDHYLPLKVIREHLDALARGEEVQLPAPSRPRELLDGSADQDSEILAAARVGRAELIAAADVDEAELVEWESYGLIGPADERGYDIESVSVAKLIADLGRFGLEPRHLRVLKAAADREADLVEQVVAPLRRHRNPQTRIHAETTARELAALSVRLHAALVQSALRYRPH
ncbi:MerR family transcriptional regulator [Streptomyces pathocidini]|uniref:MerR family transcriptional regulator n=1 Tax=Streptomyces pathocidini TaxID=1650571 RepID=A0ABW7V0H3_9ACTN|nr:MerR family transcriptional regulator [Streptomyces pathocidini]